MGVAWPGTLPKTFEQSTFSETPQDGVVRTTMSTGPMKSRRRFTAVSKYWTGTIVMNATQKETFENFYNNSLGGGALIVSFPNQYDAGVTTVEAKFRTPVGVNPYRSTLDFELSFDLEVLP